MFHRIFSQINLILHHVLDSGLGVCTITETWLNDQHTVSLGALSPSGLNFKNFPRPSEQNGSVMSVFYNLSLNCPFLMVGKSRPLSSRSGNYLRMAG